MFDRYTVASVSPKDDDDDDDDNSLYRFYDNKK
jgi:hypothetical protein